jgi:transposase
MTVKRRVFSREFKLQVLREIEAGKSQAQVAREHQINQQILTRWYREYREKKSERFPAKPGHSQAMKPALLNSNAWSVG